MVSAMHADFFVVCTDEEGSTKTCKKTIMLLHISYLQHGGFSAETVETMIDIHGGYCTPKVGEHREECDLKAPCLKVIFISFCFFRLFAGGQPLVYWQFSHLLTLLIFTFVKILARLWISLLRPRAICLWGSLRANLHFNWYADLPRNQLRWQTQPKNRAIKCFYGNLAFGGRGPAFRVRKGKGNTSDTREFDSTLGYPGEGWKKLNITTWNCRSLTFERFEYCKSLEYDVLALTELWRAQGKFQNTTNQFIVSKAKLQKKGPNKGKPRFQDDRAAGVGILLSNRMQSKNSILANRRDSREHHSFLFGR